MREDKPDLSHFNIFNYACSRTVLISKKCPACLEIKSAENYYSHIKSAKCKSCYKLKRSPTHRFCDKCNVLREHSKYNGLSRVCHDCKS